MVAGMNAVSALSAGSYSGNFSKGTSPGFSSRSASDGSVMSQHMRELLRNIDQAAQNPYVGYSKDKENGFLKISETSNSKKPEGAPKKYHYNFQEVASRILKAKSSVSAGQAVLSARRKVQEVKRKLALEDGDAEELNMALTHAKRMELVARRKKHHLEMEELVEHTNERDERMEDPEKDPARQAVSALVSEGEEKINEREDAIFEKREAMLQEAAEETEKGTSEEMLELNKMLSEFGEEELEELEESLSQLEELEIVDPHMSEEDLEELKRKHRQSESKAIMKANMDYLKAYIKYQMEKGNTLNTSPISSANAAPVPAVSGASVSLPMAIGPSGGAVDLQV